MPSGVGEKRKWKSTWTIFCLILAPQQSASSEMVDLSDPKGPVQEGISNTIFIVPAIIIICLVCKYLNNHHIK